MECIRVIARDRASCVIAGALLLGAALAPVSALAFTYDPQSMKGHVSFVKLETGADGRVTSTAITPLPDDPPDPKLWLAPVYPTTYMCRQAGDATDPPSCRSYAIYIPTSYDGRAPVPLHLSLHGNGGFSEAQIGHMPRKDGSGGEAGSHSGLEGRYDELADQHDFIVVYPNGTPNGGANGVTPSLNGRAWNDCRINEPVGSDVYDDIGYFDQLLDDVESSLAIDRGRVYAHGYSNGAIMIFRLYIALGQRFTAFATTEGAMPQAGKTECAPPTARKPIMMVFGDADVVVPYFAVGVRTDMMTADNTIAFWTQYLGTDQPAATDEVLWPLTWTAVPDKSLTDGVPDSTGYTKVYANGTEGTEGVGPTQVLAKKIHEGGHSQSGFEPLSDPNAQQEAVAQALGPKNQDVQAADELYNFFSQFEMKNPPQPTASPARSPGRFGGALALADLALLAAGLAGRRWRRRRLAWAL